MKRRDELKTKKTDLNLTFNMTLLVELLKSELKFCPTYDELVGMIESQSGPKRPSTKTMTEELHFFAIISLVVNQMMCFCKIQESRR